MKHKALSTTTFSVRFSQQTIARAQAIARKDGNRSVNSLFVRLVESGLEGYEIEFGITRPETHLPSNKFNNR